MNRRANLVFAAGVLSLHACLPADTRPEPGRVSATASLTSELDSNNISFITDDGWTVQLQNLYVSLGNVGVGPDGDCNVYSDANYRRILSFREPGKQKVSQVWGLNACTLDFGTARPDPVRCSVRLRTAMLLKWSPTSLTTWPIQVWR